ncbi:Crp/Fnr family transcriptional regulator [Vreelandella titanicae]|uniref:Crp/Fnr family transcriptional regulator n=1 Tax=Vreelandella titanicae TaxID=664683 RepID=A0A558J5W5_9GAMM|nr:Crp/Fnr family transcriptional regulator [Halomonas titanicae]TVU89048.1 Crp/Fnr family transcriptional regulator [Halomonas titanicae]
MTSTLQVSTTNQLLAALPDIERNAVMADCETVELAFNEVLLEPGDTVTYVYFPIDCFISLIAVVDTDNRLEVAMAGREGMLGTSLVLGIDDTPLLSLVQGAGSALRISAARFKRLLEKCPVLNQRMKGYVYVVMNQLAKTAACNHFHEIEARLARWLLMTQDRASSDQLYLTHEFLAMMLGVRRAGVTVAALALQTRGLIGYHRGEIDVLNRPGLIEASCECYTEDCALYARVLTEL